jgi:LPS export ABC transporter permease LptG/LPS export ABC transporter permease LptF
MKILDRYIFREIAIPMLIGLVALTFVFFSREMGRLLEVFVRHTATAAELIGISAALLPKVLTFTFPMAVLVGILTGFGRMSSDSEAIAMRAAGVSMRRILWPVLAMACIAWAADFALTVWIAPGTTSRMIEVEKQILLKQVSLEVTPRVFNEKSLPNHVLYVRERRNLEWRGIMLDNADPNNPQLMFAQSGMLVVDEPNRTFQLTLQNGNRHVTSAESGKYDFSTFDKFTTPVAMPDTDRAPDNPAVEDIPTRTLWKHIQAGTANYDEHLEFHSRIALPFACLALAFVGFPLGVSTTRGSKSMGLVLSLILMLLYYMLLIVGTRLSGAAHFSPLLGAWLPNIGFVALGAFLIAGSDRAYEIRGLAVFRRAINWGADCIASVKFTRKDASRWHLLRHRPKFFRLLDIYVLRRFWFFFVLVLVVFVALFDIITLFELLKDIVDHGVGVGTVARYFLYLLPQDLYWVVPLTVLMAILISLGALTKTNEILAVKAGSVSLYRLSIPLLITALFLSGGVYLMQELVLPYSNQKQNEFHDIIKGRAPQTYRDPERKWMVGSHDDRLYHYSFFDSSRNVFGDVEIFEFERSTFELRQWIFAKHGTWGDGAWTFEDGWVRRLPADHSVSTPEVTVFSRQEFRDVESPEYFKKEVRTAEQLSYSELKDYIGNLKQSGFDVTNLTLDLYRKVSFPLVSAIMAIIGIPFSFKTGKRGAFYGIGFCVIIGIVYWTTFELFERLGGINRLSPFIAAWFPNLIFGVSGMWMMLRVKT